MSEQIHQPICPKCGYDQSGEIATWESQCPISGVCSECGEPISWREIFAIQREWGSEVAWYSEHAHSLRLKILRTPGTMMLRLVFPHRYFRDVNHRRSVRPLDLAISVLLMAMILHVLVSPIGFAANRVEGSSYWFQPQRVSMSLEVKTQLAELVSALLYPFGALIFTDHWAISPGPFESYEWYDYMLPAWAIVGASIFWIILIGFVLLTRHEEHKDYRVDARLLARMTLLALIPPIVHIQVVRLGFGIHAATGMTDATMWVPFVLIASAFVMLFWVQLLWTHAVRRYWHIKRSFFINIGGCFGSVIFGIVFMFWVLR